MNSQNKGFIDFFAISSCNAQSRVNCAEMVGDEPTQPAYEIFAIEKVIILLLLACLS